MSIEEPTYFGDGENPADVPAGKLESGVWIDGYVINPGAPHLLTQDVRVEGDKVGVTALNTSTGYLHHATLWASRPVTTYGRL